MFMFIHIFIYYYKNLYMYYLVYTFNIKAPQKLKKIKYIYNRKRVNVFLG